MKFFKRFFNKNDAPEKAEDEGPEEAADEETGAEGEGGAEKFEIAAEEAVNFAPKFNRGKTVMVIACGFVVVVMAGIIFTSTKPGGGKADDDSGRAADGSHDFLRREMERSLAGGSGAEGGIVEDGGVVREEGGAAIPEAVPVRIEQRVNPETGEVYSVPVENAPAAALRYDAARDSPAPPPPPGAPSYSGGSAGPPFTAHLSPLVPNVEGSLFGGSGGQTAAARPSGGTYAEQFPYASEAPRPPAYGVPASAPAYAGQGDPYAAQNNQGDKKAFYDSAQAGDALNSGYFLGDNALWIGTVIPAVLETAVNTDLPGNVAARVSQNIYDSRTGKKLLIPQGTLLTAKYNSSVSYAQKRIRIVRDTLTRPDGFHLAPEGMNAVDKKGRSGAEAEYHENRFEYLKAAGIITMFSIANSKMAEQAAKYGGDASARGAVAANAEFMNQTGSNLVSRAMNIQPTLTLNSGESLNIMLNKTVYLPPLEGHEPVKKYTLD